MDGVQIKGWPETRLHKGKWFYWLVLSVCFMASGCSHAPWLWAHRTNDPARMARLRQEISLADTATESGDFLTAQAHLKRAIELNPKSIEGYVRLGRVQNQLLGWTDAKSTWEKASKLDKNDPAVWAGLAEAETALGEFEPAVKHLVTTIDLAPQKVEPHLKLGELYEAQGRTGEALQSYLDCLNIEVDHSIALMRVARIQRERGQPMQAIVRLNRVLDLSPDQPDALLQRGLAHRDQGQWKLALADMKRALELQPGRSDIKLELALLMESTKDNQEALRLVREVMNQSPELIGAKELNERLVR